jgi:hypothetical protein
MILMSAYRRASDLRRRAQLVREVPQVDIRQGNCAGAVDEAYAKASDAQMESHCLQTSRR